MLGNWSSTRTALLFKIPFRHVLSLSLTRTLSASQEKSSGRTAHYKLTSTVMLWLQTTKTGSGTMNLGGSLTRQVTIATR